MIMSDAISETVIEAPQISFLDRAGLRGFPWVSAIVLYTISYGWFWNVRNSYWADDWTGFVAPSVENVDWNAFGFAPWLSLNEVLFNIVGPSWMRLAIFLFFFASGLFVYAISGSFSKLTQFERSSITLLFLLLPFNTARVSLMTFHYSQAHFYFFFGWYLLAISKKTSMFLLACLLFFLSFQMHSLVLFFVLPLLYFLWQLRTDKKLEFKSRLAVLTALPVLYVVGRSLFWSASSTYHSISIRYVLTLLELSALIFIATCLFLWFGKRSSNMSKLLVVFGFLSSLLGISAYVLGGFMRSIKNFLPNLLVGTFGRSDWSSRHLTLLPLGASLLLVGILGLILQRGSRLKKTLFGTLLTICVFINVGFGFEYVVDYSKQQAVVDELASKGQAPGIDKYKFADQTTLLNARGRRYRARDWWGLVWTAYGLSAAERVEILTACEAVETARFVEIIGPRTHWVAFRHWISEGNMGFKVTIEDSPMSCDQKRIYSTKYSIFQIPILFYFTGAKN
jgi:hypothetical protein